MVSRIFELESWHAVLEDQRGASDVIYPLLADTSPQELFGNYNVFCLLISLSPLYRFYTGDRPFCLSQFTGVTLLATLTNLGSMKRMLCDIVSGVSAVVLNSTETTLNQRSQTVLKTIPSASRRR